MLCMFKSFQMQIGRPARFEAALLGLGFWTGMDFGRQMRQHLTRHPFHGLSA